jgi:hypothetical protein
MSELEIDEGFRIRIGEEHNDYQAVIVNISQHDVATAKVESVAALTMNPLHEKHQHNISDTSD